MPAHLFVRLHFLLSGCIGALSYEGKWGRFFVHSAWQLPSLHWLWNIGFPLHLRQQQQQQQQQRWGVCRVLGLVHRTGGGFED